jgi:hypothetical protein
MSPPTALRLVKIAHTLIWALFAGCIVAIPVAAWAERYDWAVFLSGVVLVEVFIIVTNRWRCPLTDIAARYTADRRDNFDIYLPAWLARHNKTIFGALYVAGLAVTVARWAGSR